jgi:hypothetical protein
MEIDEIAIQQSQPDNNIIFASADEIRNIEQVIDNLEVVHRELLKVAENMKIIED